MKFWYWIAFRVGRAIRLMRLGYRDGADTGSSVVRTMKSKPAYDAAAHSGKYPWL